MDKAFVDCLNPIEKRRHLLLKCGHLNSNDTLMHCFLQEMQKLELRTLIEKSFDEQEFSQQKSAIVNELPLSNKISYNCDGNSCDENSNFAPNSVTISSSKPPPELNVSPSHFWFNVAPLTHYSSIERVELLINLKKFRQNYPNNTYVVSLNKYGQNGTISAYFSKAYPFVPIEFDEEGFELDEPQWINIDLSKFFFEWRESPLTNHGIQINIAIQAMNGQILFVENLMETNKMIYLEIVNPQYVHRKRRHFKHNQQDGSTICTSNKAENTCCMYSFNVSINDFNLNWITGPEVIKLNYCLGKCSSQATGCCMAERRTQLELQYRNPFEGTIMTKNISNALIQKCICV